MLLAGRTLQLLPSPSGPAFQAVLAEMMNSVSAAVHPSTSPVTSRYRSRNLERLFQALTANDEVPRVLFAEAAGIDEERTKGLRGSTVQRQVGWLPPSRRDKRWALWAEGPHGAHALVLGMIREPVFRAGCTAKS